MSSKLEERLAQALAIVASDVNGRWRFPEPVREYRPIPERRWRVDFAYPEQKVAVECEGVRFDKQGGRHQTGSGFTRDLEKYTALELAGWRVIRVGRRQITSGEALSLIEQALRERTAA